METGAVQRKQNMHRRKARCKTPTCKDIPKKEILPRTCNRSMNPTLNSTKYSTFTFRLSELYYPFMAPLRCEIIRWTEMRNRRFWWMHICCHWSKNANWHTPFEHENKSTTQITRQRHLSMFTNHGRCQISKTNSMESNLVKAVLESMVD